MSGLICVGDVMVDVVATLPGPLAPGSDRAAPVALLGGGAAANAACWAATAGGAVTFVGRVGADALGRQAVADLEAAGVTPAVDVDPVRPTGVCIVLVDPSGERSMVPSAGANDAVGDLRLPVRDADQLYVSGYTLLRPASRPFALEALAQARRAGWSVAVDAASAQPLAEAGAAEFLAWVGRVALLFANEDEARVLTGRTDMTDAVTALGARCGAAVVKLGAAGSLWSDGVEVVSGRAEPVSTVDTTGAGDAFAAGYLTAGGDVAARLAAAAALAARAVTVVGGRPVSPTSST